MLKKMLLGTAALAVTMALAWAANDLTLSTGTRFLPGPRMVDGNDLNVMLAAVNTLNDKADGSTAGVFTGTFNGVVGGVTPAAGSFTGLSITGTGGIEPAAAVSPRLVYGCGIPARISTDGTDTTPSTTEAYLVEVFIPANMTVTGVALFNGTAVGGNVTIQMMTGGGAPISAAKTASTAQAGTDVYQLIPFAAPWAAKGPLTYYIGVEFNNAAARFNTHVMGTCGAGKLTGQTYGTFVQSVMPSTFTTNLGPYASLY